MFAGMGGFLADERFDVAGQVGVIDQGQRLAVHLAKPSFASGKQQVQHVDHVGGVRVAGHPVVGGGVVVKPHPPRAERHLLICGVEGHRRRGGASGRSGHVVDSSGIRSVAVSVG